MKQYFYVFWSQRNDYDPHTEWENYRKRVREVNFLYDSGLRPGYMTERGRVSLVYGKPDLVEQRAFEPNMPPYEIWRYDRLTSRYLEVVQQSNKIFVFVEYNISSGEYELVHSNAIGELNDRRWKINLGGGTVKSDDLDNNNNQQFDDWGSRINNNVLIQNSGGRD